jgi:hypothetical protein
VELDNLKRALEMDEKAYYLSALHGRWVGQDDNGIPLPGQ